MDNRGYQPRSASFQRPVYGYNVRRIYPMDDDEDDMVSRSTPDVESIPSRTEDYAASDLPLQQDEEEYTTSKNDRTQKNSSFSSNKLTSLNRYWIIGGGILLGICLIVLIIVLPVELTRKTTATGSVTASSDSIYTAYWAFDNDANDLYSTYNGTLMGGAAFSSTTYFGYGYNLQLNSSLNQSVIITTPLLNLTYTSFTVEAWIYGVTFSGDAAIFSQCQCSTCQDQCLYLLIRNSKMYMGFLLDDVIGTTSLSVNTWYHVAYVYDYSVKTQYIYLQGVLDGSKTLAGPYQGQSGSTVIGLSHLSASAFNGYIDNLKVTTRAKSATEILTDASVVTYFSFDGSSLTDDSGPNQLNGTLSNAAVVSGKVGQGLAFSGISTSYFQVYGYFQLGQSNKPYSFSMWIYPYSVYGGVLIQKSATSNTTSIWCYSLMGLNFLGQIVMVVYNGNVPIIVGPILTAHTWTHLGYTFSTTNGLRMYINGTYFGGSRATTWSSSGRIDYLTVGSYVQGYCGPGAIYGIPFLGAVDEFYVYRRELSASEILALASV